MAIQHGQSIRSDGQYAVLGSFLGEGGSFLVDISNPRDPTETHRLPSASTVRNADVKFDHRDGLYYRSQEPNEDGVEFAGVEIVDYGFETGSAEDPAIVGDLDAGPTHNLVAHPEEPLVYTVNEHAGEDEPSPGFTVWDVEDPTDPEEVDDFAPNGGLHDLTIDPDRELMHAAYIFANEDLDEFEGYAVLDLSDPRDPTVEGRFDYAGRTTYQEADVGEEAFNLCHYANYDPERELAYVGDEIGFGKPGGKHVFDIGWGDGSVDDPQPIGYTLSPDAEVMDEAEELFDWTGHNFDIVPKGDTTLLVSGDYHEGAVVYDVSDPTDPIATDEFETDEDADTVEENGTGPLFPVGDPPMAWGVDYSDQRDFTVCSDMVTGVYVLHFTPSAGKDGGKGKGKGSDN